MTSDPTTTVHDEVVRAYYPSVLAAGQAARNRAQVAFTITSAIAAALVAGGAFSGVADRGLRVQVLGAAGLALWLGSAFGFLRAVASPVQPKHRTATRNEFVDHALDNAENERDIIQGRQGVALRLAGGALALTFSLIVVLLFDRPSEFEGKAAHISVSPAVTRALAASCGSASTVLSGTLDPAKLNQTFVEIREVSCGARRTEIRVPASAIRTVAIQGEK